MIYDLIIVGGGIAGLTAAAYGARSGHKVLLIEKNEKCGGLVNSFSKEGFTFDGGVRSLENAGIILPMLKDLDIDLEFVSSPVSIGIEDKIMHINSKDSLAEYRMLLESLFPQSKHDVEEIIRIIKRIMGEMEVLYGVDNPLFMDMRKEWKKAISYGPWFFRFLNTIKTMRKLREPVETFLEKRISDKALMDIISQHFFKATPAFFAMSYFYLYTDYMYPKGGIGKLAEAVEKRSMELGAEIVNNTRIVKIVPAEKKLIDEKGNSYRYRKLLWAADLKTLYRNADTEGLKHEVQKKINTERERILKHRGADSVVTIFLGVNEYPAKFSEIARGHLFYTPSKQGIGEVYRSELDRMINDWDNVRKKDVLKWLDRFCRLNTYEILIPALRDPDTAPAGKTGLIISLLFEYELVKKINESGWYDEFKHELLKNMVKTLSETIYPGLEDNVTFSMVSTPLTIEQMIGSSEGAIIGWSFTEQIPVSDNMLTVRNSVKTSLPDVFKAGQWAYSPAGIPTAIMTGRLAINVALE